MEKKAEKLGGENTSKAVIEKVSVVSNPNKKGGSPRTPQGSFS